LYSWHQGTPYFRVLSRTNIRRIGFLAFCRIHRECLPLSRRRLAGTAIRWFVRRPLSLAQMTIPGGSSPLSPPTGPRAPKRRSRESAPDQSRPVGVGPVIVSAVHRLLIRSKSLKPRLEDRGSAVRSSKRLLWWEQSRSSGRPFDAARQNSTVFALLESPVGRRGNRIPVMAP
jgi:hypothetical protein